MSSKNALVIGVSEYEFISPLANTVNDAEDIAKVLRELGFKVMLETNPTLTEFEDALENFAKAIQYNKEIALFYYSGHGIQVDGKNYLIPKDAELDRELRIKKQTVGMDEITNIISDARNSLNIFILDACRDNPFEGKHRSVTRGLAEVKNMPPSTYIAFAAGAGQTAGDGNSKDRNGVFTSSFLNTLRENPSDELDMIFRKTRYQVLNKTKNKQEPWTNHNLSDTHYLIQPKPEPLKDNEKEYTSLLEMVYSDGVVAASERKLLSQKQNELGITNSRAEELEKEVQTRFADAIKQQETTNLEKDRIEKDKLEKDRIEKDRIEKDKLEKDRLEKDTLEKDRLEKENSKIIEPAKIENKASSSYKKWLILTLVAIMLLAVGWWAYDDFKKFENDLENKSTSNTIDSDKKSQTEKKEAEELAKQKEVERGLELAKQACESSGNIWTGSTCKKKSIVPNQNSPQWSGYQSYSGWEIANQKCLTLEMRLPTIKELRNAYNNRITESWKKETGKNFYWSSTKANSLSAYAINLDDGSSKVIDFGTLWHVRCIN
ncbi:MAG: caspase family protein [Leptospiraceae bacterium]|nr:caspase family protein [Leptospiraceae bacterium]